MIRLKIVISTYTYPYILSTVKFFCVYLGLNSKTLSLEISQFLHTIETSVAITIKIICTVIYVFGDKRDSVL